MPRDLFRCGRCHAEKAPEEFNRDKRRPSGLYPVCKACRREARAIEKATNPERVLERGRRAWAGYRARNRDRLRAHDRAVYAERRDQIRARKLADARQRRALRPERHILAGIRQRCLYPKHKSFAEYGGRGIRISERWLGPGGFDRFLADVGPRPSPQHSIDRWPDMNGNYEPGNVRWATADEQARNKRDNRLLTLGGVTKCLTDWGASTGIPHELIRARIDRLGWTVERALTEPVRRAA